MSARHESPRKFLELHSNSLFALFQQYGPVVRIVPREPLGPVFDIGKAADERVSVVTVRCVNDRGVVRFEAFSKADLETAEAWTKKHEWTTREEFNWLP